MAWVFTAVPTWSLRATQARESGSSLFLSPRLRIIPLSSSVSLRRRLRTPFREPGSTRSLCGLTSAKRRWCEGGEGGEGGGERGDHTLSCACRGDWVSIARSNQRSCAVRRRVERCPANKREMEHSDEASHTQAKARACRQQCRESTASSAYFSDRRFAAQAFALAEGVLGDAHKRTRHGTAEPRPCQEDGCRTQPWTRPTASHAQAWKRSTTRKLPHNTRRSDEEPLLRSGGAPLHAQFGGGTRSGGAGSGRGRRLGQLAGTT